MIAVTNRAAAFEARYREALEVDVELLVADAAGLIRSVLALTANFDSASKAYWIGTIKPLIIQAAVYIFDKLQEAEVQEYINKLKELSRVELCYHLISCLD